MRKIVLAALSACVLALAIPVAASASEWTESGKSLTEDKYLTLTGTMKFELPWEGVGGVQCGAATTTTLRLKKGTLNVNVVYLDLKFGIHNCENFGLIKSLCGLYPSAFTLGVESATGTLGSKQIAFKGVQQNWGSKSCVEIVLKGEQKLDLDSETAIKSASLTGELESNGFGPATFSGAWTASPAGVYGMK